MPTRRKRSMSMNQQQWEQWAARRREDADKIRTLYLRQADAVDKMLTERGCKCNPLFQLGEGPLGPQFDDPMTTHALTCKEG